MIRERELNAAKRLANYTNIPVEQADYFLIGLRDTKHVWIYRNGKWTPRKRKPLSDETKQKISEALKGNQNARKGD